MYICKFAIIITFLFVYTMGLFGNNNESELRSFEQTIERLKAEYAALDQENKSKDAEIERLKKILETASHTPETTTTAPEVSTQETSPTQGADCAPAFVIALKSVDLPTFGKPTIPSFILLYILFYFL